MSNMFDRILDILAIIIPIIIYILMRKKYRIIYTIPDFQDQKAYREYLTKKFRFKFNKNEMINSLIRLRFINQGNQSIKDSDFDKPIIIKFDESTEIKNVSYDNCYPPNIDLDIRYINNSIKILPFVFNASDSFDLIISLSYLKHKIKISGRIINVSEIEYIKKPSLSKFFMLPLFMFSILGFLTTLFFSLTWNEISYSSFIILIFFIIIFSLSMIGLWKSLYNYDRFFR